jgi:Tfp pilus assembly protein PilV
VELLVAGLLLSIGLMAIVQTWTYSFFVTASSDDSAVAYTLGRQAVERAKTSGFTNAAEGTTTTYYTGNQSSMPGGTSSRYTVRTTIASDVMTSGTSGQTGGVAASYALRNVTVTVSLTSGGTVLYQTSTYLCRGGI